MYRILIILLTIGIISTTNAQNNSSLKNTRRAYVQNFLKEHNATEKEKKFVQCEMDLVYSQYQEKNKVISENITTAFNAILSTYRNSKKLDKSHRLFEPTYDMDYEHTHGVPDHIDWEPVPQDVLDEYNRTHNSTSRGAGCPNIGFEDNDFSNWSLAYSTGGGVANLNPGTDLGANHAIMTGGTDGNTNGALTQVYPNGGNYSMRLGDDATWYNAAKAEYTFTVTPQTAMFIYHYAVVMEDPGHSKSDQPFMKIEVQIGSVSDPCGYYYQAAEASAPGYIQGNGCWYKPWSSVSISLLPYMGQTVQISFVTSDCGLSGHFGYGYIDAECATMPNLQPVVINCFDPTPTVSGPTGAQSYSWTGPGIIGPTNQKDIQVNQPGTYTVTVIPFTSSANPALCAYQLDIDVTENLGTIDATLSATPTQMCFGTEIDFQSSFTTTGDAGTIDEIRWDFDDGNESSNEDPPYTYSTPGTYDVELTVITTNGCTDTVNQDIIVSPIPVADFSVDTVCQGTSPTLVDLSSINTVDGNQIQQWYWSLDDGTKTTGENPTLNLNDEKVYNITLVVESNNGCSDTITKTAIVYPTPVVGFSPTEVCFGFPTHFTNETTVSNNYTNNHIETWDWDFDDGHTDDVRDPIHSYQGPGVYDVTLTATTNHGCTVSEIVTVTVNPEPIASFVGDNLKGCSPFCPEITSTSTVSAPSTIVEYRWELSDGTVIPKNDPVFTDCYETVNGEDIIYGVELTVTTDKGCVDSHSEPNYIEVFHNPIADYYYTPEKPDVLTSTVEFHNISSYADYYQWTIEEHGQTSEVNPVITFSDEEPRTYQTQLIAYTDYGCTDTAYFPVRILDRVIFYVPNTFTPDNDNYNESFKPIFFSGFDPQEYSLFIYNRWGELIFESHNTEIGWDGTYGVESEDFVQDGTYIWKISFKERMTDKRHNETGFINLIR